MLRPHAIITSIFLPMAFILPLTGCGPELSEEELGRVEYRLPEISGAEKPYELPDWTQTKEQKDPLDGQKERESAH